MKSILQQFVLIICLTISSNAISASLVDITYTADNAIRAFYLLDNSSSQILKLGAGAENWKISDSITIELETDTTYELIWQLQNVSGIGASPGGFLAEIKPSNQFYSHNLLSSSAWKIAFVEDKLDNIDLSSLNWTHATEYGSNNDTNTIWYQFNEGPIANISNNSSWIWWETNFSDPNAPWANDSVFVKTTIYLKTVPRLTWLTLLLDNEGCYDNSNCSKSSYCSKPIGDRDGKGVCSFVPQACIDVYDTVCGCDGKTYGNACDAASMSINVQYEGPCITCIYDGVVYNVGDVFPDIDGCNTCNCLPSGMVACTEIACSSLIK